MVPFKNPPSWALRFLQWFCPTDLIEEVEGDLFEAYQWRQEAKGENYARKHYIMEVIRCLRYLKIKVPFTQNSNVMLIKNYLKTGFRFLWKTKGYSAINIVGLAMGVAICWMSYVFVSDEYSYDRFYENADELYRFAMVMQIGDQERQMAGSSYIMGDEFTNKVPGIKAASRFKSGYALLSIGQESFGQSIRYADPSFFDMFSIKFLEGNSGAFDSPDVAVIDKSTAIRLGMEELRGNEELELSFNGEKKRFTVKGIFEDIPKNSSLRPRIILPFAFWKSRVPEGRLTQWFDLNMNVFFQLEKSASESEVNIGMTNVLKENVEIDAGIKLQPLTDIHTGEDIGTGNGVAATADRQLVTTVTLIGILCLVIACLNYSNFAIGNYLNRLREVAVRKVFGAQKKYIFHQFVSETFISVFIALIVSIGVIALILPMFSEYANKQYTLETIFGSQFLLGGLVLLILVTILAGAYPALVISRYTILSSLSGKDSKKGKHIFTKLLVVGQFAIAVFLIASMLTINKQLNYMLDFDIGYNDEDVVSLYHPTNDPNVINKFKTELLQIPSVEQVTMHSGYNGTNINLDENTSVSVNHIRVDPDFISTLKIPIIQGRDFDKSLTSDFSQSVIVNETLVRELGLEDPIGKHIAFKYGAFNNPVIIGVVKDYHNRSLHSTIPPVVMYMSPQYIVQHHFIKINPENTQVIDEIERVWKSNFSPNPFEFDLLKDVNQDQYDLESNIKAMSQSGALIAVILSCLGLMGVVGMQVRQRLKEVSIRKVIGATPQHIMSLFSLRFIGLVLLGFTIGMIITSVFITKWLEDYTNRIQYSWDIGGLAILITLVVASITIASQLYKAMYLNPVTYLKEE